MKQYSRYKSRPATEKAVTNWTLHILRDYANLNTNDDLIDKRIQAWLKGFGTIGEQRYVMHRLKEILSRIAYGIGKLEEKTHTTV